MEKYHIIAFIIGFFLDQIIGDPYNIPHPIRAIGSFIGFLDKKLLGDVENKDRDYKSEQRRGILLCILVIAVTVAVTGALMFGAYFLHPYLGMAVEAMLTCYILAAKSLHVESMKVYDALRNGTIEDARKAVSMIVGRDTECLDEAGVTRAVVETIAENTSDGVIAPLIFTFIGGPVLGLLYKAINTMDSMVGYHNTRYEYFGKAAAKLDDVANYIPSRLSALFMILATLFGGKNYSFKGAAKIFKRDRYNHKSPNSAQTESVCAGALSLRLAGDASYFGKVVKKPYIGDPVREIEIDDIKRASLLMYLTEYLCGGCMVILWVIAYCALR
ncbi:adenosylcobinamide-phosphate synthase CbiB [Butyrivibrio sp. DSM 10294]|uniref:adenosylcobinamide-phosphate synthase CbiB n=1 Tax=Butyrivibrio sp. DSM 10294 TaxID=2972457 RepID=UPI00234F9A7C|nr:adenosylcobinamide-phosphate synthase CbiB [Butyrivibrio sp. DSM 10294]MDC7294519.1 adenosylcobinamide-phosphate synthase CbiB [Butyrivibrio sp. DSM 10294]